MLWSLYPRKLPFISWQQLHVVIASYFPSLSILFSQQVGLIILTCQAHAPGKPDNPDKPCKPASAVATPARSGKAPKGPESKTEPKTRKNSEKKTTQKSQKKQKKAPASKAKAKPAAAKKKVYEAKVKDEVERKMHSVSQLKLMLVQLCSFENSLAEAFVRQDFPEVYSNAHVAAKNLGLSKDHVKKAAAEARLKFPN